MPCVSSCKVLMSDESLAREEQQLRTCKPSLEPELMSIATGNLMVPLVWTSLEPNHKRKRLVTWLNASQVEETVTEQEVVNVRPKLCERKTTSRSLDLGSPMNRNKKPKVSDNDVNFDWGAAIKECEASIREKWASLTPVVKNFYKEDPKVACVTRAEADAWRKANMDIYISHYNESDTRSLPNPVTTFDQAFVPFPDILQEIVKNGFKKPSPIQSQSWPVLLSGHDSDRNRSDWNW